MRVTLKSKVYQINYHVDDVSKTRRSYNSRWFCQNPVNLNNRLIGDIGFTSLNDPPDPMPYLAKERTKGC